MNRRTAFALAAVAVTVVGSVSPAQALKKKSGSFTFTDNTPNPTYDIQGDATQHCHFAVPIPDEAPHDLQLPAKGKLKVSLSDFQGDWALEIRDSSGKTLGGDDGNPPDDFENATVTIKKKGTYKIFPCNIGGTPTAKVTWSFTY